MQTHRNYVLTGQAYPAWMGMKRGDRMTDEDLLAVVVPRPEIERDPADLVDWCAGRLASFKVPRFVQYVGALPKTPTQKVEKHRLRDAWDPSRAAYDREAEGAR